MLYPCYCSRKTLAALPTEHSDTEAVYPGYCRQLSTKQDHPYALRIKTESEIISFVDALQGNLSENIATQHGDFIVKRKDQIFAYQLAVVIDDHLQGVNHIVRGTDLLQASIKQLYLHNCLNLPIPNYAHLPVITNPNGSKLSKKHFAPAVDQNNKQHILFNLLQLLKQNPPTELEHLTVHEQLAWATKHWKSYPLTNTTRIAAALP